MKKCFNFARFVLLTAALCVCASVARAQSGGDGEETRDRANQIAQAQPLGEDEQLPFMVEREKAAPNSGKLALRALAALCLIVGAIFFAGWGWKKIGGKRFGRAPEEVQCDLKIVSSVALGNNRSLNAVRFGDKTLLVGATAQSFTLLAVEDQPLRDVAAEYPARSVAALLAAADEEDELQELSFANKLAEAENRFVLGARK